MSETIQLILLGVVFATLGIASLWLKGMTKGTVSVILGFLVVTAIIATFFGVKYIFINGLFFGLASMVYAAVVLIYRLHRCTNELLEIKEQEKNL